MTILEQEVLTKLSRACSAYIENQKESEKPNWEQRRYEIAKDIFVSLVSKKEYAGISYSGLAETSVCCADTLIKALKKE